MLSRSEFSDVPGFGTSVFCLMFNILCNRAQEIYVASGRVLEAVLKFKPFIHLDNKHRFKLDSDVNSSRSQVHIDFKGITLSKGITNSIHKIKSNRHYCLNLHYRHLTV